MTQQTKKELSLKLESVIIIWLIILTVLVVVDICSIGYYRHEYNESVLKVKGYETELFLKQLQVEQHRQNTTEWRMRFIQDYLDWYTKGDFKKRLSQQPFPIHDKDEEDNEK